MTPARHAGASDAERGRRETRRAPHSPPPPSSDKSAGPLPEPKMVPGASWRAFTWRAGGHLFSCRTMLRSPISLHAYKGKQAYGIVGVTDEKDKWGAGMTVAGRVRAKNVFATAPFFCMTTIKGHRKDGTGTTRGPFLVLRRDPEERGFFQGFSPSPICRNWRGVGNAV